MQNIEDNLKINFQIFTVTNYMYVYSKTYLNRHLYIKDSLLNDSEVNIMCINWPPHNRLFSSRPWLSTKHVHRFYCTGIFNNHYVRDCQMFATEWLPYTGLCIPISMDKYAQGKNENLRMVAHLWILAKCNLPVQ